MDNRGAQPIMSTAESPANSIVDLLAQDIARSFEIGTDADGHAHHYYAGADAVVVYDGRELDHYQPLDGRTVAAWWEYVNARRGWTSEGQLASLGIDEDRRRKVAENENP